MNSKHTKGPWRIGNAGHAVFGPKTKAISPETIAQGLTKANAKLICVAPEMLKALENMLASVIKEDKKAHELPHIDKQCLEIRVLIKKAKGE